ncbi:MAG TPA: glycerate kinase [Steroidobacteraceae bacterium]|jgi:glycerate 2-kinase|nr:glycerate kinase [Steroidobacteraceae bacterium]
MTAVIDPRTLLRRMFDAAIDSAQPARHIQRFLPTAPSGRLVVVGAGKASAAMAQAVEKCWSGPLSGLVVTRGGYAVPCRHIEIIEGSHPVPDGSSLRAAERILASVQGLKPDDLVLALMSGGASALLTLPLAGLALDDKQALNRALLTSGAPIGEMNCVRRHLSGIKGGRLAAACFPAKVVTLVISDVPGDNPTDIGSGPTVGDPTTCADALSILDRYHIEMQPKVREALTSGRGETVKPDDPRLRGIQTHLIATPQMALEAAAVVARAHGVQPLILSDRIEGEARDVGKVLAGIAQQVAAHGQPAGAPCVLLSGGETTVTVRGDGSGGRNVELLLSLAVALDGHPQVHAIAGDTDGVDGAEDIAGAYLSPDSLARARALGINPRASLERNDGHGFFKAIGDSVVTGPTFTNVNDFRAVLIAG